MALVPGVIPCSYVQSIFFDGLLNSNTRNSDRVLARPEDRSTRRILDMLG